MCSSDSCFSEILGLGKHACYADSRTTNFTHLTSPPSVRRCTASRTRLLPVFCTSCWSASWFILTLFHRFICVCVPFLWPIIFYQLDPIRLNGKVLRYYLTIAVNSYSRNRKAWLDCLEKPWEGKSQHLAAMQMSSPTTSAWHWLCKRVPFKKNNKKDLYIYIYSHIYEWEVDVLHQHPCYRLNWGPGVSRCTLIGCKWFLIKVPSQLNAWHKFSDPFCEVFK